MIEPEFNLRSPICQCRCLSNHPGANVCHWGSELHELFGGRVCMSCAAALGLDREMAIRELVDVLERTPTNPAKEKS